jgi:hypothetical protein
VKAHSIDVHALKRAPAPAIASDDVCIRAEDLSLHYQRSQNVALHNVSLEIPRQRVTAFIGPSGCGKSSLLRCFNRMNELIEGVSSAGGSGSMATISTPSTIDVAALRRRVGWCSSHRIRSRRAFMKTSPSVCGSRVSHASVCWMSVSRRPARGGALERGQGPSRCERADPVRVDSSSAWSSPGQSPSSPRSCFWTSRPLPWIRFRRCASKS